MQFDNYTLRLVQKDDLENYFNLIDSNRKRLEDFFAGTVAITSTIDETALHLADVIYKSGNKNYFPFVVVDNTTGKIIASLQVKSIDWSIPKAELGYYVDKDYEGKGIVSKATSMIVDFCFRELKMRKLFIRTYEGNMGSRKVAENNGFILEGILSCDYKTTSGRIIDSMYYGLLNPDFRDK